MKYRKKFAALLLACVLMITVVIGNGNGISTIKAEALTPKNTVLSSYGIYEETPGFLIRGELIRREDSSRVNGVKLRVEHYDQINGGNLLDSYSIVSGNEVDNFYNVFIRTDVWRTEIKRIDVVLDEDVADNVSMPSSSTNVGRINARYIAEGGKFENGTDLNIVPSYINGKLPMFAGYEVPTKENAEFSHWALVKGSTMIPWDADTMVIPESERRSNTIIFKAVWIDKIPTYTVDFESNGGTPVTSYLDVEQGTTISKPENVTKTGHVLDGWFTDAELLTPWNFDTDTVEGSMTLYAKWTPAKYNVKFVDTANTLLVEFKDVIYNNSVPSSYVNAISKLGHTYKIYINQALTTQWVSEGYTVSEDVIFYVDYTKEQFTLSFETNGGSTLEPMNLEFGSLIGNSHITTKSGYTFEGWFLDSTFTNPVTASTAINEDMTIYAQWKEIPISKKVTLSFETNGGTSIAQHEFQKGSLIGTDYTTTKSGYTFDGWFLDSGLTTPLTNTTVINENMTIYAQWKEIPVTEKVTLTFEANGGSELAPIVFEKGSKIGTNHSTTKKGYTFGGWFMDAELEQAVNNETTITENMTIYAKWNKNTDAVLPATGMSSSDYIFVGLAIAFVGFGITFMSKKRDEK